MRKGRREKETHAVAESLYQTIKKAWPSRGSDHRRSLGPLLELLHLLLCRLRGRRQGRLVPGIFKRAGRNTAATAAGRRNQQREQEEDHRAEDGRVSARAIAQGAIELLVVPGQRAVAGDERAVERDQTRVVECAQQPRHLLLAREKCRRLLGLLRLVPFVRIVLGAKRKLAVPRRGVVAAHAQVPHHRLAELARVVRQVLHDSSASGFCVVLVASTWLQGRWTRTMTPCLFTVPTCS
mmetsp:Transcript_3083/g.9638  ORF Transcript_3083/g.9638 Transcript_3083/m.9638 type:complete len:238 (+) Transcript_3083:159-872(+)